MTMATMVPSLGQLGFELRRNFPTPKRRRRAVVHLLLHLEEFGSLTVAQVVVEAWRIEHNTDGPAPPLATSPLPSTRPTGLARPNPSSHSEWTTNRGPVS
jgi:hypothetical protein